MDTVTLIKFISSLLYPLGLVMVFLVFGIVSRLLLRRRVAVYCFVFCGLILMLFSNPQIARSLVESLEKQYPQQSLQDIAYHDVAIVLGGGLRIPLPPSQHAQLAAGSDRYWYANRLYNAGKVGKIILSGGNVYAQQGFHGESYYAAQLMQEWGVPESEILLEEQSRTTLQNKENIAPLIAEHNFKTALLVTSAIHMPRAYSSFRSLPIMLTPASADVIVQYNAAPDVFLWLPSAAALALSTAAMHEYYGRWFTQLKALMSNA